MAGCRITPVLGFWTQLRQYCFYASYAKKYTPASYRSGHYGHNFGIAPSFDIAPLHNYVCVLHFSSFVLSVRYGSGL
jgi:hypothetical protein